jgi:hypothetical protein
VTTPDGGSMSLTMVGLSPARRALGVFAERSPATQADIDQVMRALVAHDGWYVPVPFAERAWGQSDFGRVLTFDRAAPTSVLTAFTDQDCALLADGQPLGRYGGPVPGQALMAALDASVSALIVNPASPREHQWYIAAGGFEIAVGWATALAAERALARRGRGPVPVRELLAHRFHLLVDGPTRSIAQVVLPELDGHLAVCFTAPDRAEEFARHLSPAIRPLAEFTPIDGPQLFDTIRGIGSSGLVVNAGSEEQTALTREDLAEISVRRAAERG